MYKIIEVEFILPISHTSKYSVGVDGVSSIDDDTQNSIVVYFDKGTLKKRFSQVPFILTYSSEK